MRSQAKIPFLLYSYLATEMLGPFFASFLVMNCVFFLVKFIPFLNFVLELNIGLADFIRLFSYLFPNIFLYSIPMSAMMGVTIGVARLSSDSEVLAFKASGISMYQILPPVFMVAALIALLTSYISVKLIPLSAVSMKQLSYQLLKEKISSGIKEHVFTEALGDVVIYVEEVDKESGDWNDVWVSDMRGVENPIITMASKGKMKSSLENMNVSIMLSNGSLHKPGNDNAQIVQFDQYKINIPLQPPDIKATRLKRTALTMTELLELSENSTIKNEYKRKIMIEFHKRLVLPVGCLMISLIGLPLGLQSRPGKKAIGIQAGLVIFVLYYVIFTFGKSLAENGTLPVGPAMWMANFIFSALAFYWIMRVANEKTLFPKIVFDFFSKLLSIFLLPITSIYQFASNRLICYNKDKINEQQNSSVINLAKATTIKGNAKTREFHLPGCTHYNCPHCTLEFKDVHIALDSGFIPCDICSKRIEHQPAHQ